MSIVVSSTTAILGDNPGNTELLYPQLLPGVLLAGHLTIIVSRGVAALAESRLLDRVVSLLGSCQVSCLNCCLISALSLQSWYFQFCCLLPPTLCPVGLSGQTMSSSIIHGLSPLSGSEVHWLRYGSCRPGLHWLVSQIKFDSLLR